MGLNGRRELFAHEYLRDLNATQAAIRAGYSAKNANDEGSRLLADPAVQELVAKLAAARNEDVMIEARDVVRELIRLLNTNLATMVNEDGTVKSIHELPVDMQRAIASIEVEEVKGVGAIRTKVKLWSKEKAIEMLGRHLSIFKDVLKVEGLDEVAALIHKGRSRAERVPA
jgi:phage terminase small subunit